MTRYIKLLYNTRIKNKAEKKIFLKTRRKKKQYQTKAIIDLKKKQFGMKRREEKNGSREKEIKNKEHRCDTF